MHLCLVTETFPPEINGVAMTLSRLVAGLTKRGHRVTVVRPRFADFGQVRHDAPPREIVVRGIPIPGYPQLRLGWPSGRTLRRIWNEDTPDLVHIATEGPLGWSALRAARRLGIPCSSTFHTNFHHYSADYGFAWLLRPVLAYLRWFHNQTEITLSPTASLNAELSASGFERLGVLGRGIDLELFHPHKRDYAWRESLGIKPDQLAVVHVSRLAKEKNYPLLLRSFAAIKAEIPNARLIIVSDGPLRPTLERQVPGAHFTGFLPAEELARAYASGDLFLYPSLTETFGNVLTEAMASGLPVLAFPYAAAGLYVRPNENGLLVPLADETAFIEAAVKLAKDAALRQRLGHAARATAETLPWSQVITRFETHLTPLLRPTRPSNGSS